MAPTTTEQRTPVQTEAERCRAEAWADLQRLRCEWPRKPGWEQAMRVVLADWSRWDRWVREEGGVSEQRG